MGGCRCSYKNCTNTTKSSENIHFFHYPVKHTERCVVWIENACKPNFYDLEEEQLRNKVVCEMHFEPRWFPNHQKKRLLQGAIPTLDGECNDNEPKSPMETDVPMYLPSNQYNDVKVVPANEDGTVFVLDTENMFTRSPRIESYIIKNGIIVPTKFSCSLFGKPTKANMNRPLKAAATNDHPSGYFSGTEVEIANINTPPGSSKPLEKEQMYHCPSFIKNELQESPEILNSPRKDVQNNEFLIYDNEELPHTFEMVHEEEEQKISRESIKQQAQSKHVPVQGPSRSGVSKNYLRQIKQHSRDIANIKKMLKVKIKAEPEKPDIKTILNELQPQIPASLFTIISLLLGEKNELDEDDVEFFTTLHKASLEVYHLLSEKYKWNLPSVDVVDTPPE